MVLKLIAALAFLGTLLAGLFIILCAPFHDYYGMPRRLRIASLVFATGCVVLLGVRLSMKAGLVRAPEKAFLAGGTSKEEGTK